MIIREYYVAQIRPFYESNLIKIITGIRRCGKSVILRQIMKEMEAEGKRCLFLDFDLRPMRKEIPDADALVAYVPYITQLYTLYKLSKDKLLSDKGL